MLIGSISASCLARPSVRQLWPRHAGEGVPAVTGGCASLGGGFSGEPLASPSGLGVRGVCIFVRPLRWGRAGHPGTRGAWPGCVGCWAVCVHRCVLRQWLGRWGLWAPPQTRGWAHWGLRRNWVPAPGQVWRAKWLPQPTLPWGVDSFRGGAERGALGQQACRWHPPWYTPPPFTGGETEARGPVSAIVPGGPGSRHPHTDTVLSSTGTPSPASS